MPTTTSGSAQRAATMSRVSPDGPDGTDATDPVVAVDIGGTKVAVAAITPSGAISHHGHVATLQSCRPEDIYAPIGEAIAELVAAAGLRAPVRVGISSAGPIDGPAGTVSPVNIGGWRKYPIVQRVRDTVAEVTGKPGRVRLAGDGHCMALGEHWLGAGADLDSMVGLVVSTGVGAGAVVDNQLYPGDTGNAAHVGHISVNAFGPRCVCGGHGCVELYARGPAMVHDAQIAGWAGGDDAEALSADARDQNPIAVDVIDRGMQALAAGIASTATLLDIRHFVIGGGVSLAGPVIFEPLRRHLHDFAVLDYVSDIDIRPASLDNAGLLGAAALALTP